MKASLITFFLSLAAFTAAQPVNETLEFAEETHELSARSILCLANHKCTAASAHKVVNEAISGGSQKYTVDTKWRLLFDDLTGCLIYGRAHTPAKMASATAKDIGLGAENTITKCQKGKKNAAVGGTNAAFGNGDFLTYLSDSAPNGYDDSASDAYY